MSTDSSTTTDNDPATAPSAGRREWIGLAVLTLPTLLISIDVSVLYVALPTLSRELGATSTQQLWILDIYSFLLWQMGDPAFQPVGIIPRPLPELTHPEPRS